MGEGVERRETPAVPRPAAPHRTPSTSAGVAPPGAERAQPAASRASTEASPSGADPVAEAPRALWYVRPPAGGQYGPAQEETFRTWLAEGRVPRDSLVWREGWTDWRKAAEVFAHLPESNGPQAVVAPAPIGIDLQSAELQQRLRRRRSSQRIIWIVALLMLACVILLVVLIYVLTTGVRLS